MVSPLKRLIKVFVVSFLIVVLYLLIDGKTNAIMLATENMFNDIQWQSQLLSPEIEKHSLQLRESKNPEHFGIDNKQALSAIDSFIQIAKVRYELDDFNVFLLVGKDSLTHRVDIDSLRQFKTSTISSLDKGLVADANNSEPQARIFVQLTGDDHGEFIGIFSPIKKIGTLQIVYAIYSPTQSWFDLIKKELFTNLLVIVLVIGITLFFTIRSVRKIVKSEDEIKNELVNINQELNQKNEEITDSIKYAKRLQNAVLMSEKQVKELLPQSFIYYKPKDIVAGDFYWVLEHNDCIYFAAADCTGHGVPGAMVSMLCSNALTRVTKESNISDPAILLEKVREVVVKSFEASNEEVKDGMDISLLVINKKTKELQWAGAYNPLWIVNRTTKEFTELKGDKQPIASFEEAKAFTKHSVIANEGDVFYLFTDGYADQFGGPNNKKFRYKQLRELLSDSCLLEAEQQKIVLANVFNSWMGKHEQVDDVLVMGIVW